MKSILVADDERTIREGIADLIADMGLSLSEVLTAENGKEALEIICREKPDIVITDIVMPEMNGLELIKHFQNYEHKPEFIILSGHDEFQFAQEAMKNHVVHYLLKPCNVEELENTVRNIIEQLNRQEVERKRQDALEKHVKLLLPKAERQIMREYINEVQIDSDDIKLLASHFPEKNQAYFLVYFLDVHPDYSVLSEFRKLIDQIFSNCQGFLSMAMDQGILLFIRAEHEPLVVDNVNSIMESAPGNVEKGVRVVISRHGLFVEFPYLYQQMKKMIRYNLLVRKENNIYTYSTADDFEVSTGNRLVMQVIQYVNDHIEDSELSLNSIASQVFYLSPDYLGKLFKKECQMKFTDFLVSTRIEKAKQYIIRSDDLKISEVATKVGFGNNAAYFSQVFRKQTGLLPSEYKARQQD